ncbi:MAG: AAA family ATPase [Clostridia bacterium]|nr:AAA family ATPase [Clostridia bacterium]
MEIKSIYVSAFGSLKDFSLDLSDGFQVIYGENEAGKTTLLEFIKAMFYGSRKTAGQAVSAREKYAPFDGSQPAGRITFTHSGREFILERQFRKSDATDKVTLTDTATGKSEAAPPDIGKTLFGISLSAFERSMFIGTSPDFSHDQTAEGEINQRLADTAFTGQDNISYQKVLSRIENARLALVSKSGRTGSLVNDINECNRLIEALEETDRAAHKKQEILNALLAAQNKTEEITQEYNKAQALLESIKDIEALSKIKEYLELKERLDGVTKELTLPNGTVADEMFLKKFEFAFSKLDNIKLKAENTKEELERLKRAAADRGSASPEEIREKIKKTEAQIEENGSKPEKAETETENLKEEIKELENEVIKAKTAKKAVNLPLLIVSLVSLIAAGGLYIPLKSIVLSASFCAIGVILFILSFVIRPKNSKAFESAKDKLELKRGSLSGKNAELMAINSEKGNLENKVENLTTALNFGVEDEKRIIDAENRLKEEQNALEAEKIKVLNFFSLSPDTDIEKIKQETEGLYEKADAQKQIKLRLSYLSRDLGGISYEEAKQKTENAKNENIDFDADRQRELVKTLLSQKSEAENLKTRLETELKTGFRNMKDPEDLRREISEIKERIAEKQKFYDAAKVAYDALEESFVSARTSFGSTLQNETLENLKALSNGAYSKINVSKDFDLSAEKTDTFGMHEIEYLSRGTKDQIYLSLRLAISKLLSDKEPLPVFLDDSLSQYDDKRFLSAIKFLRDYGKNSQVCLFTCHDFVVTLSTENGIKTLTL